jgi:hypothetical protein
MPLVFFELLTMGSITIPQQGPTAHCRLSNGQQRLNGTCFASVKSQSTVTVHNGNSLMTSLSLVRSFGVSHHFAHSIKRWFFGVLRSLSTVHSNSMRCMRRMLPRAFLRSSTTAFMDTAASAQRQPMGRPPCYHRIIRRLAKFGR